MLNCFIESSENALPIIPIVEKEFATWVDSQLPELKSWCELLNFSAKPGTFCWIPHEGQLSVSKVFVGVTSLSDFWSWGSLPLNLPLGHYKIEGLKNDSDIIHAAIAWALGAYQYTRYKKSKIKPSTMVLPGDHSIISHWVKALYLTRDLINTPSENMGPAELSEAARLVGEPFNATITEIVGEDLLQDNYPAVYMVGRASTRPPRLIDLRWGNPKNPRVTLVGKGVCFDSGGLDLKTASGMALMKKDMAGAAHALGLAYMIMSRQLPVCLRVIIPAVDNVVSGNAYRPGDVLITRKGLSVEVNNTDAEGRLVLADALTEGASENPEMLINFATLTGAARVALGPDIAAMFCNNPELAAGLLKHSEKVQDPILEFPLYKPYRKYIDSTVADISNTSIIPYGGAMTAGLFLNEFVPPEIPWAHFDLMAWNICNLPGRPEGAEAMAIRAVWSYLVTKYLKDN